MFAVDKELLLQLNFLIKGERPSAAYAAKWKTYSILYSVKISSKESVANSRL